MAVAVHPANQAPVPRTPWTARDRLLVLILFLFGWLGAGAVVISRWPARRKLVALSLWGLTIGAGITGQSWLVPAGLLGLIIHLLLGVRPDWQRWLAMTALGAVLLIPIFGVELAPLTRSITTGAETGVAGCRSVYLDRSIPGLTQLPLHAGFCAEGGAVRYLWEDCGGSSTFVAVRQTCAHLSRPDGSLELNTSYSLQPWGLGWLTRRGDAAIVVRPNGSLVTLG